MAGGGVDDQGGSARSGIRHRGEHRFSLARIGPALLAFEVVLVLLAGLALFVHERGKDSGRDGNVAAGELPSLIEPSDQPSATGTARPTSTSPSPGSDITLTPGASPTGEVTTPTDGSGDQGGTGGATSPGSTSGGSGGRPTSPHTVGPRPTTGGGQTRPPTQRPPTTPPRTSATTRPPVVPTALPDAAIAAQLVSHLNGRRAGEGCSALKLDNRLSRAAQGQASDMVRRHFFRHTNPDGLGPAERAALQGWSGTVGEDLALGYENAARAVDSWWASSAQHDTLTTCSFHSIGVGYDPGQALSGYGPGAWVVLLG